MILAAGLALLCSGVLLVVWGLAVMIGDSYDSSPMTHLIFGLPWMILGLSLVFVGWRRLTRYR